MNNDKGVQVMKNRAFWVSFGFLSVLMLLTFWGSAQAQSWNDSLLPSKKIQAMRERLTTMEPDTLEAGIDRGRALFYDRGLGNNSTAKSCATCHKEGGSIGGAADLIWRGEKIRVNIPTLRGAASHFPKSVGPMKVLVDLAGMTNFCILNFLEGDPLDKNSQSSVDLVAYLTSLSKGKKLKPGMKKIVPKPEPGAI